MENSLNVLSSDNLEEHYIKYSARLYERCAEAFLPLLNNNKNKFNRLVCGFSFSLKENPKLLLCTPNSIISAFRKCCEFDLNPSPSLGKIYLIPIKNWKTGKQEVLAQIGYQGYLELALRRKDIISNIHADVVRENDIFNIMKGVEVNYTHQPKFDNAQLKMTYAVIKYKDGNIAIEYSTKEEIEQSRLRSKTQEAWKLSYESMAKIVPLRKILKIALCLNVDSETFLDAIDSSPQNNYDPDNK